MKCLGVKTGQDLHLPSPRTDGLATVPYFPNTRSLGKCCLVIIPINSYISVHKENLQMRAFNKKRKKETERKEEKERTEKNPNPV